MLRSILIMAMLLVAYALGNWDGQREARRQIELERISTSLINKKVAMVRSVFATQDLMAAARSCDVARENTTAGKLWVDCVVTADFYNPQERVVEEQGETVLLPVSIFMRAKDAAHLLERGYKARGVTVTVFVWKADPSANPSGTPTFKTTTVPLT